MQLAKVGPVHLCIWLEYYIYNVLVEHQVKGQTVQQWVVKNTNLADAIQYLLYCRFKYVEWFMSCEYFFCGRSQWEWKTLNIAVSELWFTLVFKTVLMDFPDCLTQTCNWKRFRHTELIVAKLNKQRLILAPSKNPRFV